MAAVLETKRRSFAKSISSPGIMSAHEWSLEAIGYDSRFAALLAALGDGFIPARIAADHGQSYIAWAHEVPCKAVIVSRRIASWRQSAERPQVGDWVAGTFSESTRTLVIEHVLERRTCLVRQAAGERAMAQVIAANVDVVGIVSAVGDGEDAIRSRRLINEPRLRRYLTAVEQSRAKPVLIVNKCDLNGESNDIADELRTVFPGVPVVLTSAETHFGLNDLVQWLQPATTLGLVGMSGVGKSTLVNALLGHAQQRIGHVRSSDARGRHTTTHRELFLMANGALLIDTPGIREFGLWEADTLAGYEDVAAIIAACHFSNCGHGTEPGCAVQGALAAGSLTGERWAGYETQVEKLQPSGAHGRPSPRDDPRGGPTAGGRSRRRGR